MRINEDNLVDELIKKNPKAVDYLVETYGNLLYKIIYNVLGVYKDNQLIEECLNDVFMGIWNNINKFSGQKGKFKAWIGAVARYKAIDCRRKLLKNKEYDNLDECVVVLDFTAEEEIIRKEKRNELIELINEMNEIDRKIFLKRYFMDESVNTIAKDLNLTRTNVNTRLCRGRKVLKEKLVTKKKEVM